MSLLDAVAVVRWRSMGSFRSASNYLTKLAVFVSTAFFSVLAPDENINVSSVYIYMRGIN